MTDSDHTGTPEKAGPDATSRQMRQHFVSANERFDDIERKLLSKVGIAQSVAISLTALLATALLISLLI